MISQDISVEVTDRVARIVINRPQAMNALRRETFVAMRAAFIELASDKNVRAAVVTGSGRAFCAGADLSDPMMGNDLPAEERPEACRQTLDSLMNALIREIRNAPFPVVSAVNGVAAGGGVGLALAADMVVAERSARFLVTFTPKLGLVPDLGTSWHLARHLGRARALGLALTGEPLSAEEAASTGLIWKAVDDAALEAEAMALAQTLAAGPATAQSALRRLIDAASINDFDAQLDAERDAQASLVAGPEPEEAVRAFLGKRAPNFTLLNRKP